MAEVEAPNCLAISARENPIGKENVGSKTTCTVRGSAERGGEGAEVMFSVGREGDGIFWSAGGVVFWGDDFGGESPGAFRGIGGFEKIPQIVLVPMFPPPLNSPRPSRKKVALCPRNLVLILYDYYLNLK